MRRILTVLTLAAVVTAPAVVVTSTSSTAGTAKVNCSIYHPQRCGGGGLPWSPR